jgi:MoxR-like ATPase
MSENNEKKKVYFLTRQKEFIKAVVNHDGIHSREITVTEPNHKLSGKTFKVHPDGVAWGNLYPRIFATPDKPVNFFEFKGRVVLKKEGETNPLTPEEENYHFQPITVDIIDSILQNDNTLLTGEAGTGKTTHIEQIASQINQPVIRVNMNGETRITDFLGKTTVIGGETGSVTKWNDGVLPDAMKKGYWLICDELDMAEPNILSLLHPVLEPHGKLVLKENGGEVIVPHKNFRIFGTANSIGSMGERADAYQGANQMNEAFLDRWQILEMPYLDEKTEIKVIRGKVPQLKAKWAKQIVKMANTIRKGLQSDEGNSVEMTLSTRRALKWAAKTALYRDPLRGAKSTFLHHVSKEDYPVLVRQIGTLFGKKSIKGALKDKDGKAVTTVADTDRPQNQKERDFWKTMSTGKGRVSNDEMAKRVDKLKEFRRNNP